MIRASQLSEDDLSARLNCFLRFVVRRSHRAIASRFQDAHAHWSGQSPIDILESDWSMPHDLPVSSFKLPPALRDCLARFGLHTNAEDTYRVDVQNLQLWKTAFASLYRDVESGLLDPPVEGSSKPAIKSHIPDEDIARLAEAFRRLSLLLISKLADAIFSIPSLSDRFLKLRPNTVSKIGGYIGSETNEIYNYSSELEGAGAHALRYLRLCCAHVTAARFVFVHPAFQQRLPLRIRLVTYPPADPRPSPACIDDLRAGITDDSPNAANAIAALETVRVEVRHGTLHPEAVILALAHASLPGGEVAADPPPAGFVETAHALARFFHEDESVSVGVHQDCCPSCAMLNIDLSEGDFPDIFFSPGHGTAVPWTPPPGLPSWVLKEGLKDRAAMLRSQYLSAWDTHRLSILAAV
ncbi:hypothetical protein FA95DRAFT_1561304 [Auriscalpium vulgare]|uniref:Uncharacterized protein n=1 Tax=Auriscalpium vulgare TaxID=40419 RepID=A0ACB8RNZ7_9AGAM|nr:hypothetical protein FA95DRAFT_1561304 [Auriscalpium vulgare]